jgi:hypothetical protein
MYLFNPGVVDVDAILSPTLNFVPDRGLRYAISFDDQPPQVITFVPQGYNTQNYPPDWMDSVTTGARPVHSSHTLTASGYHTLKFWMVDPGVVLEKLVVDLGGVKPSYLGPPESFYKTVINATNLPPVAVASANPTSGSAPLSVTFSSAGSLDPEGLSLTYRWTFGDGTISTAANPNHNYSAAGTYAATLNVSDGVNTVGSSNITITVTNPRPTSPLNLRLINP